MSKRLFVSTVSAAALALAVVPGAAFARDRDHDHMSDRWETRHGLNTHRNDAGRDPDHDGVDNLNEFIEHTNPRRADSDGDGIPDGREDADHDGLSNAMEDRTGNDPLDRDTDDDGVLDGNEDAGTITAFAGGVLSIRLSGGQVVSGTVNASTRIECETENQLESTHRANRRGRAASSRHGGDGQSDDTTPESQTEHAAGHDDGACGTAALVAGAMVHEAELSGSGASAVFTKLELVG
jgi:hypothetical protein